MPTACFHCLLIKYSTGRLDRSVFPRRARKQNLRIQKDFYFSIIPSSFDRSLLNESIVASSSSNFEPSRYLLRINRAIEILRDIAFPTFVNNQLDHFVSREMHSFLFFHYSFQRKYNFILFYKIT